MLEWREEPGVDFWRAGAPGELSRVAIPPNLQQDFTNFLETNQINYNVHIEDFTEIEKGFEAERVKRMAIKKAKSAVTPALDWTIFWTNEEIQEYAVRLATVYPFLVRYSVITRTFEGRDVFALRISNGNFGRKPIVFMDGGMHAREWVSQASLMYLLHRLIEDPVSSSELLEQVDWLIIPNLNPDGYHFAMTSNRLWRQNRHRLNETCVGIDLNRNWGYTWRPPNAGTCGTLIYGGESPLSEAETLAEHNLMATYRANVKVYISVHSFGDMIVYPWSYPGGAWIQNWEYHNTVGALYAEGIRQATGKNIRVGNSIDLLGTAWGCSDDHMAGEHGIALTFTTEMTRGGSTGFDFPAGPQLEALVKETFWGYRAIALHIGRTYN